MYLKVIFKKNDIRRLLIYKYYLMYYFKYVSERIITYIESKRK